jgi:hypothetical protein
MKSIDEYNQIFSLQRLGWLGGDIATSIPLPSASSSNVNKMLWLYGDSIIGVSNSQHRIKSFSSFISNSIGISTLSNDDHHSCINDNNNNDEEEVSRVRKVKQMKYYWGDDQEGLPAPIFTLNDHDQQHLCTDEVVTRTSEVSVWPITGIAVKEPPSSSSSSSSSFSDGYKLVIIASITCRYHVSDSQPDNEETQEQQLDFHEIANAVFVVRNPDEDPNLWQYNYRLVPAFETALQNNIVRWISLTEADGAPFSEQDSTIYILGTYQPERVENIPYGGGYQILLKIDALSLVNLNLEKLQILSSSSSSSPTISNKYDDNQIWLSLSQMENIQNNKELIIIIPKELYKPITSEASLVKYHDKWIIVSLRFIDKYVQICESKQLFEGWYCYNIDFKSSFSSSYSITNSQIIYYAAKIHLYMSTSFICSNNNINNNNLMTQSMDLVISIMSNTLSTPELLFEPEMKDIYTPQFFMLEQNLKR